MPRDKTGLVFCADYGFYLSAILWMIFILMIVGARDGGLGVMLALVCAPIITGGKTTKQHEVYSEDELLPVIAGATNDAIIMINASGVVLYWNPAAERMFGYSFSEIACKNLHDYIIPKKYQNAHLKGLKGFGRSGTGQITGKTVELAALRKNGEEFPIELSLSSIKLRDRWLAVGTIRDITERKHAEEKSARLTTAIEQAAETVVITDVDGTIEYANPAFEKITGYTCEESIGRNANIQKSGEHDDTFYEEMWETISAGKTWSGHFRNKKKDGSIYEEEATISPVFSSSGEITNYVAVKRDVTREVMMESQLRQSQKMEAIGRLAGGIAHDFNNILFAILGYASLVKDDLPEEDQFSRENMDEVIKAGKRAKELVAQILAFSRKEEKEFRPVEVHFIVREALKLLRASIPSTIEIKEEIDKKSGYTMADPTQIHQVIMNLCINAVHSMKPKSGIVEVRLSLADVDQQFAQSHPGMKAGRYIRFTVKDTGCGMDKAMMEKIFEPFFTTKPVGEGSGMGLAVVHGIVTNHGGAILVNSRYGAGSTFDVYLPRTKIVAPVQAPAKHRRPTGKESILFVDDEPAIVKMGDRTLTRLGYHVEAVTDPEEALKIFTESPKRFDLIITDQTMPEMTGEQLAAKALKVRPCTPIIIMTGWSSPDLLKKMRKIGVCEVVKKPLDHDELAKIIRKALDSNIEKEYKNGENSGG